MDKKLLSVLALFKKLTLVLALETAAPLISFFVIALVFDSFFPHRSEPLPTGKDFGAGFEGAGCGVFAFILFLPFYLWVRTVLYRIFYRRSAG